MPDDSFSESRETSESQEREWIERIRAGDTAAFETLFRTYGNSLYGFIYSYVRSTDDARELLHDLFLWIWQNRRDWNVSTALKPYLIQAARNRAISHLRRRQSEQRFLDRPALDRARCLARGSPIEADHEVRTSELAQAIDRAVAKLPDRCRQVFTLNRQQGLSYRETANVLGISVKTVEIHMGRALAALRKSLAPWL